MIEAWGIKVDEKEYPEFEGDTPDYDKMELYPVKGGYSWSDWWEAEASEEYKKHIKEHGEISEYNKGLALDAIRKYIWDSMKNGTQKQVLSDLREFITALAKESDGLDYQTPVWNALLTIESEHTLFQFVDALLPRMWT